MLIEAIERGGEAQAPRALTAGVLDGPDIFSPPGG
jgi:hypothetical protein